jgi:hypothetical protein
MENGEWRMENGEWRNEAWNLLLHHFTIHYFTLKRTTPTIDKAHTAC